MEQYRSNQGHDHVVPMSDQKTLGLRIVVCPQCRAFNTYSRAEPDKVDGFADRESINPWEKPAHCHTCGADIFDAPDAYGE